MIIKSRLEIILILFIFSLASGLSTYFNYNGYIRDDWGMFETYGTNGSLFNQFKSIATSLLANRPGLAAVNVSFINLIGDNPIFFYIINLIIYTVGIFFLNLFLKKILNTNTEILISLLFFPIISSTTLFSPLNLLGANVSFLLYAIGSYLLIRNIEKKKISYSIIITILFSVSLLTYEISGPLIIYTYFLIFFFFRRKI